MMLQGGMDLTKRSQRAEWLAQRHHGGRSVRTWRWSLICSSSVGTRKAALDSGSGKLSDCLAAALGDGAIAETGGWTGQMVGRMVELEGEGGGIKASKGHRSVYRSYRTRSVKHLAHLETVICCLSAVLCLTAARRKLCSWWVTV